MHLLPTALLLLAPLLVAAQSLPTLTLVYPNQRYSPDRNSCTPRNSSANITRIPFPLDGTAPLSFVVRSDKPGNVSVAVAFEENPSVFTSSNGSYLEPTTVPGTGGYCYPIGSNTLENNLGTTARESGTVGTIALFFYDGLNTISQCADIVLVPSYAVPSQVNCTNTTNPTSGAMGSTLQGGGVGAMGVVGAVLAVVGGGLMW